jgi:hypothetical protein
MWDLDNTPITAPMSHRCDGAAPARRAWATKFQAGWALRGGGGVRCASR